MLSVKKLLIKLLEALVVQTSGNWSYVKLGKLFIGAYSSTATFTITAQTGQIYQSTASGTINLPKTMNNLYSSVAVKMANYTVWSAITEYGASRISYRVLSAGSRASASYDIKAITIGKLQ